MRSYFRFCFYLLALICVSPLRAGSYDDFFQAIGQDYAGGIASLLQRGFDPNSVDPHGRTALGLAIQTESNKAAEALWRHPQLKVDQANAAGETALMLAAIGGREDWAKRLVERGAAVNREGWTPLHYAAAGPSTWLVNWLLDRGADINARAPNGTTALMMAAGYGPDASVDLLRQRGALATRNAAGLDAADFARKAGRDDLAQSLQTPPAR